MTDEQEEQGLPEWLIELNGRNRPFEPPTFADDVIVSGAYEFNVGLLGMEYLPVTPNITAVIDSTGGKREFSQGGLVKMPPGKYYVYYVDRRERIYQTAVEADTSDHFRIKLNTNISYQAHDPVKIQNTQKPLAALFAACDVAVKNVIQTHPHDALIGELENGDRLDDSEITDKVKEKISANPACSAFTIIDVSVVGRKGDDRALENRDQRQLQERKSVVTREDVVQKQGLAREENILNIIRKEGSTAIGLLAAKFQNEEYLTLEEMNRLRITLDIIRNNPKYQQEKYIKEIDKQARALEALVNAQTRPGAQHSTIDIKVVEELARPPAIEASTGHTGGLTEPHASKEQKPAETHEADEYIELLIPKKKKK